MDGKHCRDCKREPLECGGMFFCNEGLKANTCEEEDVEYLKAMECEFVICGPCRLAKLDTNEDSRKKRRTRARVIIAL